MKNYLLLLGFMAVVGCSCENENKDHHDDNNMNHMDSDNEMMDHNNNNAMGAATETMDQNNYGMETTDVTRIYTIQNENSEASKSSRTAAMVMTKTNSIHMDYPSASVRGPHVFDR